MTSEVGDITALIHRWQIGSRDAGDELMDRVYPELRKLGRAYLRRERQNHTLAATALVNELYLRFVSSCPAPIHSRTHFFALAAQNLRHILVDHARLYRAKKRGGDEVKGTVKADRCALGAPMEDLLNIDQALTTLQELDPRMAQVVELKFFGGFSETEIANALHVSINTVQRDWKSARAWLISRLK